MSDPWRRPVTTELTMGEIRGVPLGTLAGLDRLCRDHDLTSYLM